ncbi:FUSC family protein [Sunxiuqinia rutila]|uniref:FUSC family protein n=1 Tax=Sunxiuqinia rutila TaxID=1397841 RepID=UPI003D366605
MNFKDTIKNELRTLVTLKPSGRKWQIPLIAALSVGLPLLAGLYFDNLKLGLTACLGGMVILYLPESGSFTNRILTLLVSSFGFMVSFAFGLLLSFNPYVSTIAFGLFSMVLHWIILYYKTSPPRSFFFIMIAAMAICQPFVPEAIPEKIGLLGLSTMFTCSLALIYLFSLSSKEKGQKRAPIIPVFEKNSYADFWEALIMGGFMFLSLAVGHWLQYDNPYWIPISCAAVMQGASLYHIRQRTFHRILGTLLGLGFSWIIVNQIQSPLSICLAIIVLQFIIEVLVVRQYALAVIFITPLTILLAEAADPIFSTPNTLMALRFWEIVIGSLIGAIGGWLLHKEKIRYATIGELKKIGAGLKNRL